MSPSLLDLAGGVLDLGGPAVAIDGRLVPLGPADPDPFALLGVRFGPCVDAVAVTLGSPDAPVLAIDRCGEAMLVTADRSAAEAAGAPLLLDVARRSLGLATAAPNRAVSDLIDAVWLDRVLAATLDAPLGHPPGWRAVTGRHPRGRPGPPPSPELLRHRSSTAPSWRQLRGSVAEGCVRWPPVSAALARWFDDGSFARHAFALLPDRDVILADLFELLRPADAERIDAALSG
jgi:hypothetical protein